MKLVTYSTGDDGIRQFTPGIDTEKVNMQFRVEISESNGGLKFYIPDLEFEGYLDEGESLGRLQLHSVIEYDDVAPHSGMIVEDGRGDVYRYDATMGSWECMGDTGSYHKSHMRPPLKVLYPGHTVAETADVNPNFTTTLERSTSGEFPERCPLAELQGKALTVHDLDLLPVGAEVIDCDGDTWVKTDHNLVPWMLPVGPSHRDTDSFHVTYAPIHLKGEHDA